MQMRWNEDKTLATMLSVSKNDFYYQNVDNKKHDPTNPKLLT